MVTTLIGILVVGMILVALTLKKLLHICQPNEVLIFSGGKSKHGEKQIAYKPIKGGRKIKIPLFEVVDKMDLTNMAINVGVNGAFSKGGIPLNVDGVANIKIAGAEPLLGNAVQRLLNKPRTEIEGIAKETLEGNLRGVLATLTPEEVNADKLAFAQKLMDEADHDLNRLGLVLDTLKIQNVSDAVGYLDSIGRIAGAEVRKKAIIVEANSQADATVKDAENKRETELVRIDASIRTMRAEAARKVTDAQTRQAAFVAEAQGQIAAAVVQAKAEMDVQQARINQVKQQLEADIMAPAQAQCQARISQARGEAAKIIEEGKATAQVLTQITKSWKLAGDSARDVFLLQKLQPLTETLTKTVESVKVDRVTVLGVGNGNGNGNGSQELAPKLIGANEQLKAALGVDILSALQTKLDGKEQTVSTPPPTPKTPPAQQAAPARKPQPARRAIPQSNTAGEIEAAPPPQPYPPARR